MLVEFKMTPVFGAVLDKDLLLRVRGALLTLATYWCDGSQEATLEVVRQSTANMTLDLGETVLLECLLSVL